MELDDEPEKKSFLLQVRLIGISCQLSCFKRNVSYYFAKSQFFCNYDGDDSATSIMSQKNESIILIRRSFTFIICISASLPATKHGMSCWITNRWHSTLAL